MADAIIDGHKRLGAAVNRELQRRMAELDKKRAEPEMPFYIA